jgi:hypothetical protein
LRKECGRMDPENYCVGKGTDKLDSSIERTREGLQPTSTFCRVGRLKTVKSTVKSTNSKEFGERGFHAERYTSSKIFALTPVWSSRLFRLRLMTNDEIIGDIKQSIGKVSLIIKKRLFLHLCDFEGFSS